MQDDLQDGDDEGGTAASGAVVKSYLAFARRAIGKRRAMVVLVFLGVASLVVGVLSIWPRTYHCEARLMAQQNGVLATRGDSASDALRGAPDVVMRRDNLEAIAKQTDLVRAWKVGRPGVLRLKDALMAKLRGRPSETELLNGLIWSLKDKLKVDVSFADGTLNISADWSDGEVAAHLVQATVDNFLEARHVAEVTTIAEYAAILEGHATTLRTEVETMAEQVRTLRRKKVAAAQKIAAAGKSADVTTFVPHRAPTPTIAVPTDEESLRLKTRMEAKQKAISDLEDSRALRLLDLQTKLSELRTQFTDAHPSVLDTRQNIEALSKESPQVTQLRAEVADLETELKRRAAVAQSSAGTGLGLLPRAVAGGGGHEPVNAEPLPSEIMDLMQESAEDLDPAVSAQLRYAVEKYSGLRSQISSALIDLDTAQAAFKYRYRMVVPPEVPAKPIKPKVALIAGGGLFAAIVLALLSAVAAELRTGKIVESWQVQELALPVLAELQFPPRSKD